ncbi:MAG TPA: AbrB/MazE/SpoVT family DNA-binding domain-containing protein [Acidimicrobiales bacterium]|nr:AbrB/MazE/SpoVT family DNA-binding domain-containing protein [Acidimicrobiales bacterium]
MAHTERVTIGPQGRLVIPAAMRRHLGLEPGSVVIVRLEGDAALRLERQEATLDRLRARYAKAAGGASVVDELLAERREEAHRDTEE